MTYDTPSLRIDKADFFKGTNAYDDFPEGGFVTSTIGGNIFSKPGLLANPPQLGSTVSSGLGKKGVISWGVGSGASAPTILAVVSNDSFNANYYTVNPTTGAFTGAATSDTTRSFKAGITDTVFYNTKFYVTSETDITEINSDGTLSAASWWQSSKSQSALTSGIPHPMIVYESIMYVADGKYLHKNDAGTISTQVFDIMPDHIITAMIEWQGLIYVVSEPYKNLDGSYHGQSMMFSWDGLSESWYEQYFLDYRINALYVYKNQLIAWTNQFMGQWTGAEMSPLRPVSNQVFKHQITATADSMFYADGRTLVRYGSPFIPGINKKFFNYMQSSVANFAGIISIQNSNMVLSETGSANSLNFYIADINSPGSSAAITYVFNPRAFKKSVKMRGIIIECNALTTGQSIKVGYVGDDDQDYYPGLDAGVMSEVGKTRTKFDLTGKINTRRMKPKITITGGAYLRSVDYLYDASEQK